MAWRLRKRAAPRKSPTGWPRTPLDLSVHPNSRLLAQQIEIFCSIVYRRPLKRGIATSEDDLAERMPAFIRTDLTRLPSHSNWSTSTGTLGA